jgi:hypothetical protein
VIGVERHQRLRPVERLRHPRHLGEADGTQALHEARDLLGEAVVGARHLAHDDADFLVEAREVDPQVEAAAPERVGQLADSVRGEDDVRRVGGLDRAQFRDRHLEV